MTLFSSQMSAFFILLIHPASLWCKSDASQHFCETRVGAQGIKTRVNFEQSKNGFVFLIGLVQFSKCLVLLAQYGVKCCNLILRWLAFTSHRPQESLPAAS